ncbi:MAG: hypothetical protein ABEK01_00010 [Candidatus Nanohaloarchaea archaeon]
MEERLAGSDLSGREKFKDLGFTEEELDRIADEMSDREGEMVFAAVDEVSRGDKRALYDLRDSEKGGEELRIGLEHPGELDGRELAGELAVANLLRYDERPDVGGFMPDDPVDSCVYQSFVRQLARKQFEPLTVQPYSRNNLKDTRQRYMKARDEAEEKGLPELEKLSSQIENAGRIDDRAAMSRFRKAAHEYMNARIETAGKLAAKNAREEFGDDYEVADFYHPSSREEGAERAERVLDLAERMEKTATGDLKGGN